MKDDAVTDGLGRMRAHRDGFPASRGCRWTAHWPLLGVSSVAGVESMDVQHEHINERPLLRGLSIYDLMIADCQCNRLVLLSEPTRQSMDTTMLSHKLVENTVE